MEVGYQFFILTHCKPLKTLNLAIEIKLCYPVLISILKYMSESMKLILHHKIKKF